MAKPIAKGAFSVTGIKELVGKFQNMAKDYDPMPVMKAGANAVVRDAKDFAPVRRIGGGYLRNQIGVEHAPDELTSYVNSKAQYAIHQEFGTRYQKGKPHLRPALEKNRKQIIQAHKNDLERFTRGAK